MIMTEHIKMMQILYLDIAQEYNVLNTVLQKENNWPAITDWSFS